LAKCSRQSLSGVALNKQIKDKASDFAKQGIITIVPDLYRGKVAIDREEANHLMSELDWMGAIDDVRGAINYLKKNLGVNKVFVTGFCMGGALSLASSVRLGKDLAGAIVYYGIPPKELADPSNVSTRLQLHFGTKDSHPGFSDSKAQDALEKTLKEAGVSHEFYRYDGCEHAFTKYDGPNYNPQAAALSFDRTIDFIRKHSKKV